ncbi:Isoflavone reductase-like protein IRL [Colletotrichum higginsianum]|uniref:Isoflavone reductase-like protein IRL n=1 Tax=Colletotrichum higginsianum TaxID=80884 RepID=A0A4T0VN91_9PEZI|nr:Isoflavone reductase-like protein IRL [Colletotrichum higginsianum]
MSFNRIAVYGHRGRFSGQIVAALIESGAPITVLHRPSSDTSGLPASVRKIEVDVFNADALVKALRDIDIVLSLVGDEGVGREHGFVKAIPRTNVKLFVPSDLGLRYGEEGLKVPIIKKKEELQEAVRQAGIPMTVVLIANFAEFTLNCLLVYTGNAAKEKAAMCTGDYVAAAYVSIFASSPISTISHRAIGLCELAPTGEDIATVLKKKHVTGPEVITYSLEKANAELDICHKSESPLGMAWYNRKIWGTGQLVTMLGSDIWELPGYQKVTLEELVLEEKIKPYRDLPDWVQQYLADSMF